MIFQKMKRGVHGDQLIFLLTMVDDVDSTIGLPDFTRLCEWDVRHVREEDSIDHVVSDYNNRLT